jgi:hypothetical protein
METIKIAILSGQRSVTVNGIEFEKLPTCPRDTAKNRERFAEAKAKELFRIIN